MLVRFLAKNLDEINQGNIERRISETAAQSQNDDYSLVCNCKGGLNFILDKCHHPFHFKIYVLYKFDLIKTPGSFENFNKFQRPTPAITPPPPPPPQTSHLPTIMHRRIVEIKITSGRNAKNLKIKESIY